MVVVEEEKEKGKGEGIGDGGGGGGASNTYEYDHKVQDRPEAGEILGKPQRDPLQEHFDDEDEAEDEIRPVEDALQILVLVQVDILEAERYAGGEDQYEHKPFERGRVDVLQDELPKSIPPLPELGLETGVPTLAPVPIRSDPIDAEDQSFRR